MSWLDQYLLAMMSLNSVLFLGFVAMRVRSYRRQYQAIADSIEE